MAAHLFLSVQNVEDPLSAPQLLMKPASQRVIDVDFMDDANYDWNAHIAQANAGSPHRPAQHMPATIPALQLGDVAGGVKQPLTGTPKVEDDLDTALARVLEVIPDVEPDYVMEMCRKHATEYKGRVHEAVLHGLFENSNYPRVGLSN